MGIIKTVKNIYQGGKKISENKGEIKKIIRTIKNPPQGGMVDKLISSLQKEFGIPLKRIRKMISKKKAKGGMVISPKSGSAHYTSKKSSKAIAKKYFKGTF